MDQELPSSSHCTFSPPYRSNLQPLQTSWPLRLSSLLPWREWDSFALVAVVWLACEVEGLLLVNILVKLLLWVLLGGCVSLLKGFLWLRWTQVCDSHASPWARLTVLCLFSDFASVQGRISGEDAAGSCE